MHQLSEQLGSSAALHWPVAEGVALGGGTGEAGIKANTGAAQGAGTEGLALEQDRKQLRKPAPDQDGEPA